MANTRRRCGRRAPVCTAFRSSPTASPADGRCARCTEESRPLSDHPDNVSRFLSWLPRGRALPAEVWAARHRGLLFVLAAHLLPLPIFAITQGWSFGAAWAFDVVPAALGAAAASPRLARSLRSSLCAIALLCCSAVLVIAWHGTIEAHFHYFVMVGALALYEEWWAYLLAIGFVVLQHGLMGALQAHTVFNHAHSPWRWAVIHGLFVAGLAVT